MVAEIISEQELMEEMSEDQAEDNQSDMYGINQELQEAYGSPEPEEKNNQHTFLNKAAFISKDTVRTTFLSESELGRPLFNVRFLLDMHDIAKHYVDELAIQLHLDPDKNNKIANYFWEKTQNITTSGMSNKGFSMNLNVTKRMEATRRRVRQIQNQVKGGGESGS